MNGVTTIYLVPTRTGEFFARVETTKIGDPCTNGEIVRCYTGLAPSEPAALSLASGIITGDLVGLASSPLTR